MAVRDSPPVHGSGFAYRPALDGVRAFAVTVVVLFHAGVGWLPGGFLGVDMFFVLSGFLITSLLLGERAGTGRIRLTAFWGRRARRLLPALLLVLVAVVLVFRAVLPPVEVRLLRWDALAALGYVANWRMIWRGGDYFAQTSAPSPLQHTWSLGIEEQFYLLWPLIVVATRSRARLLVVAVAGTAVSVLLSVLLYAPDAVNRVYYGTDTRASALLIGCTLAILLAGRREPEVGRRARSHVRHPVFGVAALAGALLLGWAVWRAQGTDGWLYRGGLPLLAVAVAAVIAHAVISPRSPTARILALPPLVALGKISYGVYLWHWPVLLYLDHDRTGLGGVRLLVARVAATLALSIASYFLVERPIRRRRVLRSPRLAPVAALSAAAVLAGCTVAATSVSSPPTRHAAVVIHIPDAPTVRPSAKAVAAVPPMRRPGRRPGALPRVTIFGDSVAWTLGTYMPDHPGITVTTRAVEGCGIARLPDILELGTPHTNYPGCDVWDQRWRAGVNADDPDVSVILLDRWELMDRRLNGTYQHVGEPAYDAYLAGELNTAISVVSARGAAVVLLTAPYTHRMERPDGGLYPEDQPARVDAWNRLLRQVAAARHATVLDLNKLICPNGTFTWSIGGLQVRSDGLHFTPGAVQQIIAPWLLPLVARIAAGS